jgi:hypothetical protein
MNGAILVAALVAINPNFIGTWCDTKGELVATFTKEEYVQIIGPDNEGCDLRVAKAKTPSELFESQRPLVYVDVKTFQSEYMMCGNEEKSLLHVSVKFSIVSRDLMSQWYVDKTGRYSQLRLLARCDMEEDY